MRNSKTLILGLGNPILSDDSVGIFVAERLRERVDGVDVISSSLTGLHLLDLVLGYDSLFLIDAFLAAGNHPGELKLLPPEEGSLQLLSSHGFNFLDMLMLGKELGLCVPELKGVYGITIGTELAFGEALSSELRENMEPITTEIARHIKDRLCG
jgi:hydrogenase maturation protease